MPIYQLFTIEITDCCIVSIFQIHEFIILITDKDVCLTSGCITAASRILNAIDSSTDPCNDFYRFACGNFIENTFIPDDKLAVDTFTDLSDHIDIQLRTIIEDEIDPNESRVFTLVKQLHRSCMNRTEVEAVGLEPFHTILQKIGGWPAVEGETWNETAFDWIESVRQMRQIGLTTNYLLATTVGAHLKNSSTRTLRVILNYSLVENQSLVFERFTL